MIFKNTYNILKGVIYLSKLNELFVKYNKMCEEDKLAYQPDGFLVFIHEHYINNGKIKLPYPLYATWDITNYCNLHCVFCSASALGNKNKIDNDECLEIAKKLISSNIKYVSIRGGEPTLIKQLSECVKLFNENGVFVEIVSNGTGITKEFLEKLSPLNKNLIRIKISLDSTNKELNDRLRGRGSYDGATAAIETCHKMRWDFRTQMVITNQNKDEIIDMYNYVSSKGATSFGTILVLPMGRGKKTELVTIDEKILTDLIYIKEHETNTKFEKLGMGIDGFKFYEDLYKNSKFTDEDSYKFSLLKCNCAKTRINIDSNGDVYPCDMMKYEEFKMGNILTDDISQIWNCENANKFNNITRKTKKGCKDCKIKGCNTGCFGISYGIYHSIKNALPNCKLYDE